MTNQEFKTYVKHVVKNSRLENSKVHIQHGNTSVFLHSLNVAKTSYLLSKKLNLKLDYKSLVRGALLHDYFLYDWHKKGEGHRLHGFRHPYFALKNALLDFELNDIEKDVIKKHMFPLIPVPPKYKESIVVCIVDKWVSLKETFGIN